MPIRVPVRVPIRVHVERRKRRRKRRKRRRKYTWEGSAEQNEDGVGAERGRRKRAQHGGAARGRSTGVEGGKGAPQVEGSDGMTCEGDVCEFVCEDMESECGNSESRLGE